MPAPLSNPPVAPATTATGHADAPRGGSVAANERDVGIRELMAVREIAKALLTANHPAEVYELALQHVSPIVGASLSCVYVMDDGDTMRLAAAHNWPKKYAKFLDDMRVRMGSGPSGSAAALRKVVEVPDVFEDPALEDWRDVAKELGFRSLVALPLQTGGMLHGAVTFYFAASDTMTTDSRGLLRVVADQMAAAAEKARLIDVLRTTNTELERQYAAVVEARRLQDEFLANVSHELRTPLTSVLGYLSLIEEGAAGPVTTEQRETLTEVKLSSEKLLGLIGDLLDLTALKRSELTVTSTSFDPRDALKVALNAAGQRKPGVALNVENGGMIALMTSDKAKVTRILTALVANAFKFTDEGDVRVAMAANGDRLVFRISDTGVGISAEARGFVFDEFRQQDGSATRRFGGSGLGLALARQLARLLGGDVTLSSEIGKGSTFVVDLPLIYQS